MCAALASYDPRQPHLAGCTFRGEKVGWLIAQRQRGLGERFRRPPSALELLLAERPGRVGVLTARCSGHYDAVDARQGMEVRATVRGQNGALRCHRGRRDHQVVCPSFASAAVDVRQ